MTGYNLNNKRQQGLSAREKEVHSYVSLVMTNAQIAEKLFITYNTVRMHVKRIYAITGKTRYQIISEGRE